jgi:hypothetical protein
MRIGAQVALPWALRVALYPAVWLYHTAAGDVLHHALHRCTEWAEGKAGVGSAVVRAFGYIHTCHHEYLDAFGTVDTSFQWHNLVLDKLVKRALHQCLALGSWAALLRCTVSVRLAGAAARAMAELVALDMLRTVWFVLRTLPPRSGGPGAATTTATTTTSTSAAQRQSAQWRQLDHPSLAELAPRAVLRLRHAVEYRDATAMLRWGLWITPEAHALHHYNWRNYAYQYVHWGALLRRLLGPYRRASSDEDKDSGGLTFVLPPLAELGLCEAMDKQQGHPPSSPEPAVVLPSGDGCRVDTPKQQQTHFPLLQLGPELLLTVLTAPGAAATTTASSSGSARSSKPCLSALDLARLEQACRLFPRPTVRETPAA